MTEQEQKDKFTSRGRELRKTYHDQKKHQDQCSHKKGGAALKVCKKVEVLLITQSSGIPCLPTRCGNVASGVVKLGVPRMFRILISRRMRARRRLRKLRRSTKTLFLGRPTIFRQAESRSVISPTMATNPPMTLFTKSCRVLTFGKQDG